MQASNDIHSKEQSSSVYEAAAMETIGGFFAL